MECTSRSVRRESATVYVRWLVVLGASPGLAACGGGSSSGGQNNPPPTTYTVGGTISGLTVDGLVLANNGATVTVNSGASAFSFGTALATGTAYAVTVQTTPNGLVCTVSSGSGQVSAGNVTNVQVTCSNRSYSLGGTVRGLAFSGLSLTDGTDIVSVPPNATGFTMPTHVTFQSHYAVTVSAQPTGMTCSVSNGSGNMPAGAVTNVTVTCATNSYTLGGTIAGLTTTGLVLTDGADRLRVVANANEFSMPTAVAYNSPYAVSVVTEPGTGVTCAITGGSGTMPAADVQSVQVACAASIWTWEGGPSLETLVTGTPNTGTEIGVYGNLGHAAVNNWPGARDSQMAWTDSSGRFWLFGGNAVDGAGNAGDMNDLWMYDPTTSRWTWMSGSNTNGSEGTYGALGATGVPAARHSGMTWVDTHGNLWLYGGSFTHPANGGQTVILNDLWSYNIASGQWTLVNGSSSTTPTLAPTYAAQGVAAANNTPGGRLAAATWIDSTGHLWLFGGLTAHGSGNLEFFTDLWSFDPVVKQWTWASGSQSVNQQGTPSASSAPPSRAFAASWIDSHGALWLFGGGYTDSTGANPHALNDLWVYTPSNGHWTYEAGSIDANSIVGTPGMAAANNIPGARGASVVWTDNVGHVWLLGGKGLGTTTGSLSTLLDDLWTFDPSSGQWTYVSGPRDPNTSPGVYFLPGQPGTSQPGARAVSAGWVDSTGHLWMFGGSGFDSSNSGSAVDQNDLWRF